jgi:MFS family permease
MRDIKKGSVRQSIVFHLIPAVVSIAVYEIVAIQIYLFSSTQNSSSPFFAWIAAQGIGSLLLGAVSDRWSRKSTLLFTQLAGIICISIYSSFGLNILNIILLGLLFSPSPVARAALVDNFPNDSKVKIIGITFIALFIPWCFYAKIATTSFRSIETLALALLAINLLLSKFFFEDRRDLAKLAHVVAYKKVFNKKNAKKVLYTLSALIPAQLVFFTSDTFFELTSKDPNFFASLGLGCLTGTLIGILYRKTPHVSILTICYGMGLIFSVVPLITTSLMSLGQSNLSYQIMLFSNLGGFYLPFVYDIALSSVSANYRGTVCGIVEAIIAIAAALGVGTIIIIKPTDIQLLVITSVLFCMAMLIQKLGEKHA